MLLNVVWFCQARLRCCKFYLLYKLDVRLALYLRLSLQKFRVPSLVRYHKARADAETGIKSSDAEELIRISSMILVLKHTKR